MGSTLDRWTRLPRAEGRFYLVEGQQEMLTGPVVGAAELLWLRVRLADSGRFALIWGPARCRLLSPSRGERKRAF
jgi:hypothetical protein